MYIYIYIYAYTNNIQATHTDVSEQLQPESFDEASRPWRCNNKQQHAQHNTCNDKQHATTCNTKQTKAITHNTMQQQTTNLHSTTLSNQVLLEGCKAWHCMHNNTLQCINTNNTLQCIKQTTDKHVRVHLQVGSQQKTTELDKTKNAWATCMNTTLMCLHTWCGDVLAYTAV